MAAMAINIPSPEVKKIYYPPRSKSTLLKSGEIKSDIRVTYINFPEEAKKAFNYAVTIWESQLSSSVPICIEAHWEKLGSNILAQSRPSTFYVNFDGAPVKNVYYPVALAEKLSGKNLNNNDPDIICTFNSSFLWYFGIDGKTPATNYDFVTSVLHEIVHGLGFSGFLKDQEETGYFNNPNNLPSIYDYFIFNATNQQLSDNTIFNSPSSELHSMLTSDNLKFYYPDKDNGYEATMDWLFAPSTWKEGSSIYHLNSEDGKDELMNSFLKKGEAIHDPGNTTLEILFELGWKSVLIDFRGMKDIEQLQRKLPVAIDIRSDYEIDSTAVEVIFSTNNFLTKDSVSLKYNPVTGKFSNDIPVNFYAGNIEYYFKVRTLSDREFTLPINSMLKKFSLHIGPDYLAPIVKHNPVKLISQTNPVIKFKAEVTDNIGIKEVTVEYKINGTPLTPVKLLKEGGNFYNGTVRVPASVSANDRIEYRLVAVDNSSKENKKNLPATGYYPVTVFSSLEPVSGFSCNFDSGAPDFVLTDFYASRVPGFSSGILYSAHPYFKSAFENEKYNLIAQLKHPVILNENGQMSFDEIVLVEPGEPDARFTDPNFWDYVIVEGSKDFGESWTPLTNRYDAGADDLWRTTFKSNVFNNTSMAVARENMFRRHTIHLTENTGFAAGDTVLFRFRLASDQSVNGWGWAIDNLEIQKLYTANNEINLDDNVNVYPNPFNNVLFVEDRELNSGTDLHVTITDVAGNIVFHDSWFTPRFNPKKKINTSALNSGLYFLNIVYSNNRRITKKIVKE
ncbi:MAG: T9SS type A sorting domain-containing protein [Prolixibacteraceae bacterium]|nr:T9SS type A sorting domain-containing protein [Prolixibacteraceae bacterium]